MILNLTSRQYPLQISAVIDYNQYNAAEDGTLGYIVIPPGAVVTADIEVMPLVAWVGPTTAELIIVDDATGTPIAASPIDLTGVTPGTGELVLAAAEAPLASGARYRVEVNKDATAATAGKVRVQGTYFVESRTNEIQPEGKSFA